MKFIKKHMCMAALITCVFCIMCAPVTAYAGIFGNSKNTAAAASAATADDGFLFSSNGIEIKMGAEASAITGALGAPLKPVFEMDSCAYQGKDKVYTYPGYELSTCPSADGKSQVISNIYFLDSTIATPEGIKIGSTKQAAVTAYGKDYTEEFGVLHYKKGNSELIIYTTGTAVDGIEYLYQTK